MQRGYCSVATRYSPALVRQQAFSSPEATLKVILCTRHAKAPLDTLLHQSALRHHLRQPCWDASQPPQCFNGCWAPVNSGEGSISDLQWEL